MNNKDMLFSGLTITGLKSYRFFVGMSFGLLVQCHSSKSSSLTCAETGRGILEIVSLPHLYCT